MAAGKCKACGHTWTRFENGGHHCPIDNSSEKMINSMFLKRPYYVYILILMPLVFNLWWQYGEGSLFEVAFTSFCIGTVLNTWFFCNFQDKLHCKYREILEENFDLKGELLIAKMPHLAKSMKTDSLD